MCMDDSLDAGRCEPSEVRLKVIPTGTQKVSDKQICAEIYDAIVSGRIPPGAKLGQDELGKIFDVSKTRIRPILHLLSQQNLVEIIPMRGAFVSRPSIEEARAVNAARQIIEEGVAKEVAHSVTAAQLEILRENVAEEQRARLLGDSMLAHRLTGEFHIHLAAAVGNEIIVDIVRDLISRDGIVVSLYLPPNKVSCSLDDHLKLIDAIGSGDGDVAASCMRKHLQNVFNSLVLEEKGDKKRPLKAAFEKNHSDK